jgi:two-component system phosphate regulon response regulator PhoB
LVVDDEAPIRELCRVNLELHGYEVFEAADGQQALEAVRRHRPAVVFLDLMMPVLDGWATLRELKADPETAPVPVVLLTARAAEEDQVRGWEEGIVEFVAKPFNPWSLIDCVERALQPTDPQKDAERRQRILEGLAMVAELRKGNRDGLGRAP